MSIVKRRNFARPSGLINRDTSLLDPRIQAFNPVVWLESSQVEKDSGSVSIVYDLSGNKSNASQLTLLDQATYSHNTFGEYPSLQFNGTTDFYELVTSAVDILQPFSVFMVQNHPDNASFERIFNFNDDANNNIQFAVEDSSPRTYRVLYRVGGSGVGAYRSNATTDANVSCCVTTDASSSFALYENAVSLSDDGSTALLNATENRYLIGARADLARFYSGKMAQFLVFQQELSAANVSLLHSIADDRGMID